MPSKLSIHPTTPLHTLQTSSKPLLVTLNRACAFAEHFAVDPAKALADFYARECHGSQEAVRIGKDAYTHATQRLRVAMRFQAALLTKLNGQELSHRSYNARSLYLVLNRRGAPSDRLPVYATTLRRDFLLYAAMLGHAPASLALRSFFHATWPASTIPENRRAVDALFRSFKELLNIATKGIPYDARKVIVDCRRSLQHALEASGHSGPLALKTAMISTQPNLEPMDVMEFQIER